MPKLDKLVTRVVDLDYPIELRQQARDRFSVQYGNHLRSNLSYSEAALEFGHCVLHSAACAGKLRP